MSRDSLPALVNRRGADGANGDAAVRPGQVQIQNTVYSNYVTPTNLKQY